MRFAFIDVEKANHEIKRLCRLLEVSRSGYYAWRSRLPCRRDLEDREITKRVVQLFKEGRGFSGSPTIHGGLLESGVRIGRKRVARLMVAEGLRAKQARKYRPCTASKHHFAVVPNVLGRRFKDVKFFRQVWVGDVTYIGTDCGWLYLAVVIDIWSRRVVGWSTSKRNGAELSCNAFDRAVKTAGGPPAMFHSDRGTEYAASNYVALLGRHGVERSMSRKGSCWDNALAESFFATIKKELLYVRKYSSSDDVKLAIFEYIEVFYNRLRRHSALGYKSPVDFHRANQPRSYT